MTAGFFDLRITSDNQITVLTEIPQMGQGSRTVDTMMLADELEADWSAIRVEQAPVIPETYQNLVTGGTGAAWDYIRKVGAESARYISGPFEETGLPVVQMN
jgi:isoquinoline 1-oxidoreductase beta subunit